ncbi:MAG: transposase [Lachnospiraceae bacterium]|nr:transposase [Lachnospiraceae bacterium]
MGEKDITEKALISCNDVFADIVNNLVFGGKKCVDEAELEQAPDRGVYRGDTGFRELERDVSKYWKANNIRIALLGIENQTVPEDDMPIRVIGYDGLAYRDQIRYETDEKGIRRKIVDRCPVITLVLYFGYEKHWDKARTLHEALGDTLIPELKGLVNDYAINLYEIAYLTDEQLEGFQSDFKYVADYFVQKQRTGTYTGSHEEMKHVREVLQLMSVLTGDNRFASVTEKENGECEKGEIHNMCDVLDAIEKRGFDTGYGSGYNEGEASQAKNDAIGMYQEGIDTSRIAKITGISTEMILGWLKEAGEL